MTDEHELILRAKQGDMNAFQELVYRHDRAVFAVAARFVKNSEDAKDIFQEVFIKVHRGLKGFQGRSEFSTWVYRIAVNTCLTHKKKASAAGDVMLDFSERERKEPHRGMEQALLDEATPEKDAIQADHAHHIRAALDRLSPQQRMVFTLRHYEGHTLREIASVMQCTEGTIKRYLFLATRRMRDQLQHLVNV